MFSLLFAAEVLQRSLGRVDETKRADAAEVEIFALGKLRPVLVREKPG